MNAKTKYGGPAFPRTYNGDGHNGMSLRDYFAAKAMPVVYKDYWEGVRLHEFSCDDETWPMNLALDAYRMADAMLAAREVQS